MATRFQPRLLEARNASEPEPTAEPETVLVPASRSSAVLRALAERVDREGMRMVPSLAAEMAKNAWQADLDAFRLTQAARVGSEALKSSAEAMARNNAYAQQLVSQHPELEADITQMVMEINELMKQLPRVGVVTYTARYYQSGPTRHER